MLQINAFKMSSNYHSFSLSPFLNCTVLHHKKKKKKPFLPSVSISLWLENVTKLEILMLEILWISFFMVKMRDESTLYDFRACSAFYYII